MNPSAPLLYERFLVSFTEGDIIGALWARTIFDLLKRLPPNPETEPFVNKVVKALLTSSNVFICLEVFLKTRVAADALPPQRARLKLVEDLRLLYRALADDSDLNLLNNLSTDPKGSGWVNEDLFANLVFDNALVNQEWSNLIAHLRSFMPSKIFARLKDGQTVKAAPAREDLTWLSGGLHQVWTEIVARSDRLTEAIKSSRVVRLQLELDLGRNFAVAKNSREEDPLAHRTAFEDIEHLDQLVKHYVRLTWGLDGCLEFLLSLGFTPDGNAEMPAIAHLAASADALPVCLWNCLQPETQTEALCTAIDHLIGFEFDFREWLHAFIGVQLCAIDRLPKILIRKLLTLRLQLIGAAEKTSDLSEGFREWCALLLVHCCARSKFALPPPPYTPDGEDSENCRVLAAALRNCVEPDGLDGAVFEGAAVHILAYGQGERAEDAGGGADFPVSTDLLSALQSPDDSHDADFAAETFEEFGF